MAGPTLASQRTFPQQEIEIVRSAPVSISDLPLNPRVSSIVGATTTGRMALARAKVLPVSPIYRNVLQFRNGMFLAGYSDDGISIVSNINDAKLFHPHAVDDAADLFCARILVVLCSPDGNGTRRTMLRAYQPLTGQAIANSRPACGTSIKAVPAFSKAGGSEEKEAVHKACGKEVDTRTSETNGVKSNDSAQGGLEGGRELPQNKIGALSTTRVGDGADGWAKTSPSPFLTAEGKKLFFEFLSSYLDVEIFAVQPGFKQIPNSYLFRGPRGTTLAISVNIMLLPREDALAIIQAKIAEKVRAFGDNS